MKKRLIFIAAAVTIIVFVLFVFLFIRVKDHIRVADKNFTRDDQPGYIQIFKREKRARITFFECMDNKKRYPICWFDFTALRDDDNEPFYRGIIYKVDCAEKLLLNNILPGKILNKQSSREMPYSKMISDFNFHYLDDSINTCNDIFLSSNDSLVKIFSNDSIAYYHLKINRLSIGYAVDKPDITMATGEKYKYLPVPANLMIIKKKTSLYFIMLTVPNGELELDDRVLFDIVKQ